MKLFLQLLVPFAICAPTLADWRDRARAMEYHTIKATHNPRLDESDRASNDLACWKQPEDSRADGLLNGGWHTQGGIPPRIIALDSIANSDSGDCLRCFDVFYYGQNEREDIVAPFLSVDRLTASD